MAADVELESWRRHWQAAALVPPDLKGRVESETRRMRLLIVTEVIVRSYPAEAVSLGLCASPDRRPRARHRNLGVHRSCLGDFFPAATGRVVTRGVEHICVCSISRSSDAGGDVKRSSHRASLCADSRVRSCFDLFGKAEHTSDGVVSFLASSGFAWVWLVTAALAVAAVRQRQRLARELETLTKLRKITGDGLGNAEAEGGIAVWDSRLKTVKRSARKKLRGGLSAKN